MDSEPLVFGGLNFGKIRCVCVFGKKIQDQGDTDTQLVLFLFREVLGIVITT